MTPWRGSVSRVSFTEWRGIAVAVVVVVLTVVLAGCLGFGGGSGGGSGSQSLSDVQVESSAEEGVVVAFNYSVSAETTALVSAPNGTVLTEQTISPNNVRSTLSLGTLQPGEYELSLRQGDSTVASQITSFEGANPEITAVRPNWSGNSLQSVVVTVRNNGDLPAYAGNATVSVDGTSVTQSFSRALPANESTQLNISTTENESITITDAGTVNGSVTVLTDHESLTGTFQNSFSAANLTVTTVDADWNESRLEHVEASVQNTGDLPTTANVTIQRNGTQLATAATTEIPAGWTKTFETTAANPIYRAAFGDTTAFRVVANSSTHRATREVTKDIPPAEITIESMTPVWKQGHLESVVFNATNAEAVAVDTQAQVSINGTAETTTPVSLPGDSTTQFTVDGGNATEWLFTPTTRGHKAVELTLTGGGTSKSERSTTLFGGRITSISATFASSYDDDKARMDAVSFDVENTGYVPIGYDSAEISIDGTTRTDFLVYENGLARGGSTSEYLSTDIAVSDGMHEITVRLMNDGKIVLVESATVVTTE